MPSKRKCSLPTCLVRYWPKHARHYFHSDFCHQEARLLYGAGSQIKGVEDERLIADVQAGRWMPLYVRSRSTKLLTPVARW